MELLLHVDGHGGHHDLAQLGRTPVEALHQRDVTDVEGGHHAARLHRDDRRRRAELDPRPDDEDEEQPRNGAADPSADAATAGRSLLTRPAVALTGLAPDTVYCVDAKQAYPDANDPAGTDLARSYASDADATAANPAWTSAVPVAPLFTALIQRMS